MKVLYVCSEPGLEKEERWKVIQCPLLLRSFGFLLFPAGHHLWLTLSGWGGWWECTISPAHPPPWPRSLILRYPTFLTWAEKTLTANYSFLPSPSFAFPLPTGSPSPLSRGPAFKCAQTSWGNTPGIHHILLFPQEWLSLETSKEGRIKRAIYNAGRALPFCKPPLQMVSFDPEPDKEWASDVSNLDTLESQGSTCLIACTYNIFWRVSFGWIRGLTLKKKGM